MTKSLAGTKIFKKNGRPMGPVKLVRQLTLHPVACAQWELLAIFGSLHNPDFLQILGPKMHKKLIF